MKNSNIVVVLNNIRSNENVGSIFRTADATGVKKIFLTGYTPAPVDKFGRINKALVKSALGAEKFVEWEKVSSLSFGIKQAENYFSSLNHAYFPTGKSRFSDLSILRKSRSEKNFLLVAVEQSPKSKNYKILNHKSKTPNLALVFGNEITGLSKKDLNLCDFVVEIPMQGKKESLNVAVAVGVILFTLT